MLSARIHRDLTHYRPKVVAGLTARNLAFTVCALAAGIACGLALTVWAAIPFEEASVAIYAVTIPFWALGYIEPAGMRLERWLPLWLRGHGASSRITYDPRARLRAAITKDTDTSRGDTRVSKAYRSFATHVRTAERMRWENAREGA